MLPPQMNILPLGSFRLHLRVRCESWRTRTCVLYSVHPSIHHSVQVLPISKIGNGIGIDDEALPLATMAGPDSTSMIIENGELERCTRLCSHRVHECTLPLDTLFYQREQACQYDPTDLH